MEWVKGDLLEANLDYYCHQVNCQGKMGSGIAKSIKEKWPIVYKEYCDWHIGYEAWAQAPPPASEWPPSMRSPQK